MTPEQKCVNLETAKKLKDAGFPQDTERAWSEFADGTWRITQKKESNQWNLAAPDAQEIGSVLQQRIPYGGYNHLWWEVEKREDSKWDASLEVLASGDSADMPYYKVFTSEVEGRAGIYLYLKEEKLI